ncbi:MAG: hypothetical protein M1829_000126 [Trizodia sp. TS-e1964]|nr:MAG: hypothetical protein M1829_000126 [Trizodia sp. TS-e1964]
MSLIKQNILTENGITYYPVLIVGAGASGIAMGCRLKEVLGFDQFRIFEKYSGIGGTWHINRYPGIGCDIPAVFYSFSFCQNTKWSEFYPYGPEILRYLHDVCEKYKICDKIQLNTSVTEAKWLKDEELWEVTLLHWAPGTGDLCEEDLQKRMLEQGKHSIFLRQETVKAKVLLSAVGGLTATKSFPEKVPGKESFQGDIFHSAKWNYKVDLNGKNVIVVGTGCSAAQFVPLLTKAPYNAKSVTQLMRSPPWTIPRPPAPLGAENWKDWGPLARLAAPLLSKILRAVVFLNSELDYMRVFGGGEEYTAKQRAKIGSLLVDHMRSVVPKKYHEMLTPDYEVGCKRRIFDAGWLESLNDPKIDLTTQPLTSIQPHGVTLGPGRCYPKMEKSDSTVSTDEIQLPADTIILANGFDVTNWLLPMKVTGVDGKSIHDVWDERGGPQAYMGTAMDGFPNFFIIFGPNTATGHSSVLLATENMVSYALKLIAPIIRGDATKVEVKKEAELAWTADIQAKLVNSVFQAGGCSNWYKTANGWNSVAYPYSQFWFSYLCMFPTWKDWNYSLTRKGMVKREGKKIFKYLIILGLILTAYRTKQSGFSYSSIIGSSREVAKAAVEKSIQWLELIKSRI